MPDVNLLKNTEKYDPAAPKPTPPPTPGPLSEPVVESTSLLGKISALFRRGSKLKAPPTITPVLGQSVGSGGRMNLEKGGRSDRILAERKSKPTMIKLPDDDDALSVNLLGQDIGRAITLREQLIRLAMVAAGSVVIVGLAYAGLEVYSKTISTDIQATRDKITALRPAITALEKTQVEIAATTKKITAIRSLIDRHVYWSKFFQKLEAVTSPNVYYGTSFVSDLSGAVTLAARTDSFDSVATQYLYFQQAVANGGFIKAFTITGATQQETTQGTEVVFTAALELAPEVFYVTIDDFDTPAAETPDTATVPSGDSNTNTEIFQ